MIAATRNHRCFYIDGQWVDAGHRPGIDVINPADEQCIARIPSGSVSDIDTGVRAARRAFGEFSLWSVADRRSLLESILEHYLAREGDIATAISQEMGAPIRLARGAQTQLGADHVRSAIRALESFAFESRENRFRLQREAIGVCGLITPWNWPMNQIAAKVAPAIAAGCTMVLKPSEESPVNAMLFAEVLEAAGVPPGVFNLVHGLGAEAGQALAAHPEVDKISFTGSTRGGIAVAKAAADNVKRVSQELGGKSANLILEDADLKDAVVRGVRYCMHNSGQSCNAPTRMLVHRPRYAEALDIAHGTAQKIVVDRPDKDGNHIGPVVNQRQYDHIQRLIRSGIHEGAALVTGGAGRPDGLERGYYVRPTVFACPDNGLRIAREEIFGPVLTMIPYDDEEDAVRIANDTRYGLAAYISTGDEDHGFRVARRIRAGQVSINYCDSDPETPFGGYKESGNGREMGRWGLESYLELKAITGHRPA